jgi:hypothetical protein
MMGFNGETNNESAAEPADAAQVPKGHVVWGADAVLAVG